MSSICRRRTHVAGAAACGRCRCRCRCYCCCCCRRHVTFLCTCQRLSVCMCAHCASERPYVCVCVCLNFAKLGTLAPQKCAFSSLSIRASFQQVGRAKRRTRTELKKHTNKKTNKKNTETHTHSRMQTSCTQETSNPWQDLFYLYIFFNVTMQPKWTKVNYKYVHIIYNIYKQKKQASNFVQMCNNNSHLQCVDRHRERKRERVRARQRVESANMSEWASEKSELVPKSERSSAAERARQRERERIRSNYHKYCRKLNNSLHKRCCCCRCIAT